MSTADETLKPVDRMTPNRLAMPLQFHRAVEDMEIWSATNEGYSFVTTYESPAGPGFHGRAGYMASWRPIYEGRGAIRITGSPFKFSRRPKPPATR
jgi:hypothetical protein